MANLIPLLALTSAEYSEEIHKRLGKGRQHGLYLYQEWFRKGLFSGNHPAFNNASGLKEAIANLTDFSLLEPCNSLSDGATQKILLKTKEGLEVETVVIPMEAGGTLCVSSQVGCRMGCRFCETGKMGLLKNLSAAEIVSQCFYARHVAKQTVRNVVFMGMGEPFDNYDAVLQAFRVLNDPKGLNIGARHITVSTSGLVNGIERLAREEGATPNLAVSINAPNDGLRKSLMPVNVKHDLQQLHQAIRSYNQKTGRQVLVAYVLLKGLNDTHEHANELGEYLTGLDIKINLIPYNSQTRELYQPPDSAEVAAFKSSLAAKGYQVLVRGTKGDKIMAACGQLGNQKSKKLFFAAQSLKGV